MLLAVMLSTSLVAIDATILATAVPSVVDDLGGFTQFPWLFSIYLLAQAVAVPLYGKFADQVGRKPVMQLGIALFLLGSILCGLAWSMPALIVFRAVQGLGAGAVLPMGQTIIGDLYSLSERATVQGYVASVWGISSVIGPTLGGVFSDYLSWRWIFFANIPIAIAASIMLARGFQEEVTRRKHRIDVLGAVLLAVGGSLLVLGLIEGGIAWDWDSPTSIGVLTGAGVLLILFGLVESRAAEPILPLWVFGRRIFASTSLVSLIVGVLLIGLSSYVPLYAQGVYGTTALVGGFTVAAMTVGWPIAASLSGRLYLRYGFRSTAFVGSALILAGSVALLFVDAGDTAIHLAVACFVIGAGLGLTSAPALVGAQHASTWSTRGVVTGTNMFARSVGSAVGIAVFGAIANAAVSRRLGGEHPELEKLSAHVLAPSIHEVFVGGAVAAVVMVAAVFLMPRKVEAPEA